MSEYKVSVSARIKGLFGRTIEGVEIYEADSAKQAMEKCEADFKSKVGILDEDEVEFIIKDVVKL